MEHLLSQVEVEIQYQVCFGKGLGENINIDNNKMLLLVLAKKNSFADKFY